MKQYYDENDAIPTSRDCIRAAEDSITDAEKGFVKGREFQRQKKTPSQIKQHLKGKSPEYRKEFTRGANWQNAHGK